MVIQVAIVFLISFAVPILRQITKQHLSSFSFVTSYVYWATVLSAIGAIWFSFKFHIGHCSENKKNFEVEVFVSPIGY